MPIEPAGRHPGFLPLARILLATLLLALVARVIACYPLSPWLLAASLAAYAILLCYRPALFLLVLPVVLPAWDLGLWSGWMMLGESDLFVLTTLAVLLVRTPPERTDLLPSGLSRSVLLALVASWVIATAVGLASPLGAPHSDNAFLRPDNALRLAKGFAEALVLLPFLRQRERTHADAVSRFGYGMAAGLTAVAIVVLAERALFPGILDFSAEYRVAGPFSSMRVGGGHIGAYVALALPFALCLVRLQPRWLGIMLLPLTCLLGGYTLVVTFARTAYAAGAISILIAGAAWASSRQGRRMTLALTPVLLVVAALAVAAVAGGMRERLAGSASDFQTRQANWQAGLAVRDTGVLPTLFGMGLGTYQRAMLMRSPVNRPSDLVLRQDGQGPYVSLRVETPFFLGQKIVLPPAGDLHLTLLARSPDNHTTLNVLICDKVLLYSDNCRGGSTILAAPDSWQPVTLAMPVEGLGRGILWNWLRRPVEFALFGDPVNHRIEIRDIRLTDETGQTALHNADFDHGLDRWIFTDDSHVSWRMLNQYLMLWFETGIFGLAGFLAINLVAIAGGVSAARDGALSGAAVAGSVTGFLISCLFDNLLEAPRLATVFFLVCLCGLMQWESRSRVRGSTVVASLWPNK